MRIRLLSETFPIGHVVITPNAEEVLDSADIGRALQRHASRDWGDVGAEDKAENELSLRACLKTPFTDPEGRHD